jgi:hypothetical protein
MFEGEGEYKLFGNHWSKPLHRSAICVIRDPGSKPCSVTAGRNRETHGMEHNWPRHIVAAGFRVKWALCQEAVRLGFPGLCLGGSTALDPHPS